MNTSSKRKPKPMPLRRGDVIKTHPREGYWGCAVVLTEPHAVEGLRPMCHIGITPLVFDHEYAWAEIEGRELSILEFDREVRIAPNNYGIRHETTHLRGGGRDRRQVPALWESRPAPRIRGHCVLVAHP